MSSRTWQQLRFLSRDVAPVNVRREAVVIHLCSRYRLRPYTEDVQLFFMGSTISVQSFEELSLSRERVVLMRFFVGSTKIMIHWCHTASYPLTLIVP